MTMNVTILYLLGMIFCLPFSWYINTEFFEESALQTKFSDFMDSGVTFFIFLIILSAAPIYLLVTQHQIASSLLVKFFLHSEYDALDGIVRIIEPFVFVISGSVLFQYGFRKMSDWNLIRNIPRTNIRSAAIGIAEMSGSIVPEQLLSAMYSQSPCVYYRCELFEYRRHRDSNMRDTYEWVQVNSFDHRVPFWLQDRTGKILVNAEGAEFKLSPREEGFLGSDGAVRNSPNDTWSYRVGDRKYVEYFIAPGDPLYVLGTVAIQQDAGKRQVVVRKGTDNTTFIISSSKEKEVVDDVRWEMLAGICYGIIVFMTGVFEIVQSSELL